MKTIDLYLLAITQAVAHWFEEKYKRNNYWLSVQSFFLTAIVTGVVSIIDSHIKLLDKNSVIDVLLQGMLLIVIYFIIVSLALRIIWNPFIVATSIQTCKALQQGKQNPMIRERRGLRYASCAFVFYTIASPLYFGESVDYVLVGIAIAMCMSVYFLSVQPLHFQFEIESKK